MFFQGQSSLFFILGHPSTPPPTPLFPPHHTLSYVWVWFFTTSLKPNFLQRNECMLLLNMKYEKVTCLEIFQS